MQLFSADARMFSKKLKKKKFDTENMKKPPSKVAHNQPPTFFSFSNGQKQKSCTPKIPLMQDWAFRLGIGN